MSRSQTASSEGRQHLTTSTNAVDALMSITLASPITVLRHCATLSDRDFSYSAPYGRKSYGIFGDGGDEEDLIMSRCSLRTPVDVKRKMLEVEESRIAVAKNLKEKRKRNKGNERSSTSLINSLDGDSGVLFLRRSFKDVETFSSQTARRKNTKKSISSVISLSTQFVDRPVGRLAANFINDDVESMTSFNRNKIEIKRQISGLCGTDEISLVRADYFGLDARKKLDSMFLNSNNDARLYPTIEDLPESRRTPRTLYLRGLAEKNLIPLPLTMRKDCAPYDVSLAHR